MTATGPEGTAWRDIRGGASGGQGKGLHQGGGHGPRMLQLSGCLDSSQTQGWGFGGATWSPGLGIVVPVGPFQLGIFCDFVVINK